MTQDEIEREIKRIVFKHLSPKEYKVFVYGSRATGQARKWSDWDIGIIGNSAIPDENISAVKEELEESKLPVKVDVVDFSTVDPEFKDVALQEIRPWTH